MIERVRVHRGGIVLRRPLEGHRLRGQAKKDDGQAGKPGDSSMQQHDLNSINGTHRIYNLLRYDPYVKCQNRLMKQKDIPNDIAAAESPGRGRPRNQQTHDAILDAAREVLRLHGYAGFSMEQVAALAAVSKTSIYRRWSSKGALLIELYMEGLPDEAISESAKSLKAELRRYLLATVERLQDREWRTILSSLVAESQYDESTAALLRDKVVMPRRESGLRLLRNAQARGEIEADIDHEVILDMLFGPIWYRLLFVHARIDADFAERLLAQVNLVLFGKERVGKTAKKR
ncbi:TetR/AcrR family transcriptional regulator [Variovorax beijingensis]|uniref:TetR/AcrR family transcriptional regulator n=1 Tax=Variovorax beijingensis TaxID=2496117 RepID=UPI003F695ED0